MSNRMDKGLSEIRAEVRETNNRMERMHLDFAGRMERTQADLGGRIERVQQDTSARIERVFWVATAAGVAVGVGVIAALFTMALRAVP